MIGISRRILDCMILKDGNRLSHESLVTFMAEVCAVINSIPLINCSFDPDQPEILSPNILLTHKNSLDEPTMPVQFSVKDIIRSQWKLVQGFADEFWSKWTKEYMHTLQTRSKWENPTKDLNVGDVVLMRDRDSHRSQWPLEIVKKVLPSDDGKIRKVEIQTVREINLVHMSRPVIELVLLVPIDSN